MGLVRVFTQPIVGFGIKTPKRPRKKKLSRENAEFLRSLGYTVKE